jgi:hypothetical protein
LLFQHPVGGDVAGHPELDLDGDLLAPPDQDQVDVLDDVPNRVPLHRLGQRDLAPLVQAVEVQQHVRRLQREHQLVPGQAQVPGLGAVPVQHGGNPPLAAAAAGGALAELVADLGCDMDLGHGAISSTQRAMRVRSVAENATACGCRCPGSHLGRVTSQLGRVVRRRGRRFRWRREPFGQWHVGGEDFKDRFHAINLFPACTPQ